MSYYVHNPFQRGIVVPAAESGIVSPAFEIVIGKYSSGDGVGFNAAEYFGDTLGEVISGTFPDGSQLSEAVFWLPSSHRNGVNFASVDGSKWNDLMALRLVFTTDSGDLTSELLTIKDNSSSSTPFFVYESNETDPIAYQLVNYVGKTLKMTVSDT
ncbi:TPA: hypothetical protein ACGTRQ_004789 [Vibrio parahaemolyticus]